MIRSNQSQKPTGRWNYRPINGRWKSQQHSVLKWSVQQHWPMKALPSARMILIDQWEAGWMTDLDLDYNGCYKNSHTLYKVSYDMYKGSADHYVLLTAARPASCRGLSQIFLLCKFVIIWLHQGYITVLL